MMLLGHVVQLAIHVWKEQVIVTRMTTALMDLYVELTIVLQASHQIAMTVAPKVHFFEELIWKWLLLCYDLLRHKDLITEWLRRTWSGPLGIIFWNLFLPVCAIYTHPQKCPKPYAACCRNSVLCGARAASAHADIMKSKQTADIWNENTQLTFKM